MREVHTQMVGRARNKGRKDKLVKKWAADPSLLYIREIVLANELRFHSPRTEILLPSR